MGFRKDFTFPSEVKFFEWEEYAPGITDYR